MEVRIGRSVDLDTVPDKVVDMLQEIDILKANHLCKLAIEMLQLGHYAVGSTLIDDARQVLAKADRGLTEAQMILKGYEQAKQPTVANESDVVDSTGEADAD